jgi:hypothetical protein
LEIRTELVRINRYKGWGDRIPAVTVPPPGLAGDLAGNSLGDQITALNVDDAPPLAVQTG